MKALAREEVAGAPFATRGRLDRYFRRPAGERGSRPPTPGPARARHARSRRDDDPLDTAVLVHEQVGERADLPRIEAHAPAPQVGEGAATGAIETKLPLEKNERRLDGEAVPLHLAGREGQKAVRAVSEADFEPEKPAERLVEHCIHGGAETHGSA